MIFTKHRLIFAVTLLSVLTIYGCGHRNYVTADLSVNDTAGSQETTAQSTKAVIEVQNDTDSKSSESVTTEQPGISTAIHLYQDGNVSIEYPSITQLADGTNLTNVNDLLKQNALEILSGYSIDPAKDHLSVTAKIIAADRKRISVLYTGILSSEGAAHPTNVYYTSVIDLKSTKNIRLTDYVDPKKLAEYVLSKDCQFYNASPELTEALMDTRLNTDLETYTSIFKNADFSGKPTNTKSTETFPESFSYEDKGVILVSIPVAHVLGDFAVVAYTPETK